MQCTLKDIAGAVVSPRSPSVPRSVLIVDDNKAIRDGLARLLHSLGWMVKGEAENGAEAVPKAVELKPDLVLLDFSMPQLNGVETASILKKTMPEVRVIVFTLYDDSLGPRLASAAGIDAVVSKRDGVKGLVAAVQNLTGTNPEHPITDARRPTAQD